MASGQGSHALTDVHHYAFGTQLHAGALLHAYDVGVPAGKLDPWTVDFMRRSVEIWLLTCPEAWITHLGHSMSVFARIMAAHELEQEAPGDDWALLLEQAGAILAAVVERLPEFASESTKRLPYSEALPGILRYDMLAAVATKSGCVRLEAAAVNVAAYCRRQMHGDLSAEEIGWLRALHRGERTADIAVEVGYSERDFYRALRRLWEKLGVGGRAEAIGLASRMGWLDEDR